MKRWRGLALTFASLMLVTLSIFASPNPAAANGIMSNGCGPGPWVTPDACKYDQAKNPNMSGDCFDGNGCNVDTVYWKGGTFTGACAPGHNNISTWHLDHVKIVNAQTGNVLWRDSSDADNYHTNCDVDGIVFTRSPNIHVGNNFKVEYEWDFYLDDGSTFVDTGYLYIGVG